MTDQVLLIDPKNFKALIRRASAFIELGNLVDAKEILEKAKNEAQSADDNKIISELTTLY